MGYISWSEVAKEFCNEKLRQVRISIQSCRQYRYWAFRLSKEQMRLADLRPGDRLDVLIDPDSRRGQLRRVTVGGWKLLVLSQKRNPAGHVRVAMVFGRGLDNLPLPAYCKSSYGPGLVEFELP